MKEKKEILENLYDDFLKERDCIQNRVDDFQNKISEINSYIHSITSLEDSDFKVFSPRDVESIYKDSLQINRELKSQYENDYQNEVRKKEVIEERLNKIEFLLSDMKNDSQVFEIQENERQRIARDLHDSSLQNLTHCIHKMELVSLYIDKDPIQAKLELASISKNMKETINEIRNTIFNLRPMQFDDLGLKDSIERLAAEVRVDASININCNIEDIDIDNKNASIVVFRIIQECINNAVKHSNGDSVKIEVKQENDCFDINVTDNGEGFDVDEVLTEKAKRHFGLLILEERVNILHGTIDINSEKDRGTNVHVKLPIKYLVEDK